MICERVVAAVAAGESCRAVATKFKVSVASLAALRSDCIEAPCVIDGPINRQSFLAYVEQILVPALRPGDIVIIDNLGSHKGSAVRHAIRAADASESVWRRCDFIGVTAEHLNLAGAKLYDCRPEEGLPESTRLFLAEGDLRQLVKRWRSEQSPSSGARK